MSPRKHDPVVESAADRAAFALLVPVMLLWYGLCRLRRTIDSRCTLLFAASCAMRGPTAGAIGTIEHEAGHCFLAWLPGGLLDDSRGRGTLMIYENGRALGPAHSDHAEIRHLGAGRFSHWSGQIWFSSSDNTDPRTNGRNYTYREAWE